MGKEQQRKAVAKPSEGIVKALGVRNLEESKILLNIMYRSGLGRNAMIRHIKATTGYDIHKTTAKRWEEEHIEELDEKRRKSGLDVYKDYVADRVENGDSDAQIVESILASGFKVESSVLGIWRRKNGIYRKKSTVETLSKNRTNPEKPLGKSTTRKWRSKFNIKREQKKPNPPKTQKEKQHTDVKRAKPQESPRVVVARVSARDVYVKPLVDPNIAAQLSEEELLARKIEEFITRERERKEKEKQEGTVEDKSKGVIYEKK